MVIILFLEPRFLKYEKHLLMWKLISDSCTLSRLYFFYRNCPSRYPGQQPISARAETEPVVLCKIKYWASHKNTLGDRPFILSFSHLVPIPLIFLHSVMEAKQRFPQENPNVQPFFLPSLSFWQPFLSSVFTPSPRQSKESCIFFNNFSHLISEAFNPKLQSSFLSSAPSPLKVLTI